MTALATPAAAPEETSRASAPWQQPDGEPVARSKSVGAASMDAADSTATDASPSTRRGLLQSAARPVATPPTIRLAREDADVTRGIVFSLEGSLDASADPTGALAAGRLVAVLTAPLLCGERASVEKPFVTCGALFQVTPDGEKGEAIPLASCASSASVDSACAVRDSAKRVWFAPEPGGRDPAGPSGAAYATLSFVVVDVVAAAESPYAVDADRRSETAVAPVRVNAKPIVPSAPRRTFVDSDRAGVLPLELVATDADGDEVSIEITSALPGNAPVLGTRLFGGGARGRRLSARAGEDEAAESEWRAVAPDGVTPGAGLLSGSTLHALTPGSKRIWFAPRGVGASDACCPERVCAGVLVAATCAPCFDDGTLGEPADGVSAAKPENDCLCCPARHFYGRLTYVARDAFGSRSNAEGTVDVYVRPGSRAPETPPDDDARDEYWAPPRTFATEGRAAYFRLAARNFGEETCVEHPANASAEIDPFVLCAPEPLGAVILDAPAEGSLEEAEKGSLRAVIFPENLANLDAAFGDGGLAARLVSGFDKDRVVFANRTQTVIGPSEFASRGSRLEDVSSGLRFAGYEPVAEDGVALHGVVSEAVRLGVASVASLTRVDVASAAAFPAVWTSSLGPAYDNSTAHIVPPSARLILAYTPPAVAAGFPFVTFAYGITDAAGARSANASVARVFVRHALDLTASRFTRFPHWAFRPISASDWAGTRAEDTVDWWELARNGSYVPGAALPVAAADARLRVTNFLVRKRRGGEMGAFAYPFGRNDIGQLGMGSARPRRFPTLADDIRHRGLDLDRLAVGSRSTIGISHSDGKAYAWGDGAGGRLGTGDAFPRTSPTAIGALGDAVVARVAAFGSHAAAVTETGHLWCWGDNDGGQLGRPRRVGRLRGPAAVSVDPVAAAAAEPRAPRRVTAGGLDRVFIKDVAVGDAHTVALDANGTLWTFGSNSGGQLGRLECLIQNPADGAAGCETWGAPAYGILETPAAVGLVLKPRAHRPGAETAGTRLRDADLSVGVKFRFVAASARYTVAISDGPPPGSAAESVLAAHATRDARAPGGVPPAERPQDPAFPANATVMGQEAFDAVASAIGGRVYTFGWGDVGQLGHGVGYHPDMPDAYRASVPTQVAALEGVDVVQVSAGPTHVAAVDRAGRVYTWGAGSYGQLGHGDRRPRFSPRVVRALLGVNVTSVAVGARHTVAVDDVGEVYAWGSNEFGELGLDPPPPLDPNKGPPYLTLRGWTQDELSEPSPETDTGADATRRRRARRSLLRIDTEDDPAGEFDLIFERLRDAPDGTGDVAHSHATFRALVAGVEPTTPPPWSDAYRFAEAAASDFDLDSIRNRAYGWGWTVGQVAASAGRVESVALPQLVHRLAQVSEAAAGDGFTVAVRRACRPGTRLDRTTGFCVACLAGTFSDEASSETCVACPRGRVAPLPGASACEACAPGTVAAEEGASACTACPPGTFLGFGGGSSLEQCAPCAPGTFAAANSTTRCAECPPGSYQSGFGATECAPCPSTTFSARHKAVSSAECLRCPAGSASDAEGAAACAACAPGFVAPEPGMAACLPCQVGTYAEGAGGQACAQCPVGTFGVAANASSAADGCRPCGAGNFSSALGATECTPCPPGFFSEAEGSVECEPCPPGFFGKFAGKSSEAEACFGCPPGRANPTTGSAALVIVSEGDAVDGAAGGSGTAANASSEFPGIAGEDVEVEYVGCTPCAPGTYTDRDESTACTPCPPGTSLADEGATSVESCAPCAIGTFAPVSGLDACLPCPPGTFAEIPGAVQCEGCPAGLFSDVFGSFDATGCEACPPGFFSDVAGTGNCTACFPGTYSAAFASPACDACPVGTFLPKHSATSLSECEPCPVGTFTAETGSSACSPCPPGTFADVTGAAECSACPPGTANPSFGGNATDACVPCAVGTVAPVAGMITCDLCAKGTYVEETGQTACVPCPAGTFLPSEGSSWAEDCLPCPTSPLGTFAAAPGAALCSPCPMGTFSNQTGAVRCSLTAKGTYLPVEGANSSAASVPCHKGTFAAEEGMALCQDCLTGSYAEGGGSVACTPCDAGFFLPIVRATDPAQCRPCGIGTRSPQGAGSCIPCSPGTYGDREAMAECTACPKGTVNPLAGAASVDACVECGKGFHNAFEGRALCLPCPPGTYGNQTGMPECWKCPPGTFIAEEGALFPEDCALCAKGRFAATSGSGECALCPVGTYNENLGMSQCELCPARTYGLEEGADSRLRCDACPRWHFNSTPGSSKIQSCVYAHSGARFGSAPLLVWTLAVTVVSTFLTRARDHG